LQNKKDRLNSVRGHTADVKFAEDRTVI